MSIPTSLIRLALHGGAGDLDLERSADHEQRDALRAMATEGLALLQEGASALDVAERMVVRLEDCPLFNAGIGAVLNRDGHPELDAAIIDGRQRRCGAVAGVTRARSPIRLARAVMERSPHVLMAGVGAEALNQALGLETVVPDFFVIPERRRQLQQAQAHGAVALDHDSAFGTVGCVARDTHGHLAAATSTGGLTNKLPGRVGDTPIPGAGTFADDRSVAVSCTGTGESFIRAGFGADIDARVRYGNAPLRQACEDALAAVREFGGRGGCIAIDHRGELALPFNTTAMYRAWVGADGAIRVAVGPDEAPATLAPHGR